MVFTEKELRRIADNSEWTQREDSEQQESRSFLEAFYGSQASGLKEDHAWFLTQVSLDRLEGKRPKPTWA